MALIDQLQKVNDKASFISFVSEFVKEKKAELKLGSNDASNNKEVSVFLQTALAWAESTSMHDPRSASNALTWRKYATSLFCRKFPI